MKGAHPQDRKQKSKKQDLQVPYPGYLGRVINMFDLGNGVVATKMLTEKAHRDVSPAGKERGGTFKMASNQFPARTEDKQRDGQLRRTSPTKRSNSPTNRSGVAPVKMLMEQDMWREGVPDDEPMNVVARLMGLNDAPVHQSDLISGRRPNKEYRSRAFGEIGLNVKPKKESRCYQNQKAGAWHEQTWGGLGDQPSKINISKSRHQGNEPSCDKRMSLVREKFAEAKRLATDEKLLHSKEFQEALQFLSSNKDMFLKFLDEPSQLLSNTHYGFEPVTPPSEIKQITILKPSESMKRKGNIHVGRQIYSDESETEGNRCRHHQSLNVPPVNSTLPEPTRIVVLKPGLAKSHEDMIPVSPLASSTEPDSEDDSVMAVDEIVSSRRLAKEITWQMRMRLKDSQDEDNSLSYEYHDTYIEGGSFSKSVAEIAEEVSGEISEDLEFGTPTSGRSWEFLSRSDSPYSASCSSQASHRREPSVVKEAKRRILERWSVVSSTVSGEEEKGARRSTGTLGEMLTIPEGKKDQEEFGGRTFESRTPELATEDPFSCLPRSRSLPLSLSYGGREPNKVDVRSKEAANEKSRKPASFREKVSSLFSKNKKSAQDKLNPSGISSAHDTLTNGSAVTIGDTSEGSNHFTLDNTQKLTLVKTDENVMQRITASSCQSNDVTSIPSKDICPLPSFDSLNISGESQEQPSPVSVLDPDGPFLCDNNRRLLYSSENFITASSHALSRSPLIGSFSRSLAWEDPPQEVMSPNSLRLSRLFSKADEDQDSLTFIQKLVSSAGMDRKSCVLASPLDPKSLEKLSDFQGEGIKSRERRSKEKLLFDAVNEALTELTWTTQLSAYPWGRTCSQRKECDDSSCNSAADEIWRVIRSWSILDKYPPGEVIERNLLLDMILNRELVETASADTARLETFEINTMVCTVVLDDLLEEALVDLANNT